MAVKHPIRMYREKNGLTQAALAEILGVKPITVHRWEKGLSIPRRGQWQKVLDETGVRPNQLAGFKLTEQVAA